MLPRKLTLFCTFVLLVTCAIEDSASQIALGRFQDLPLNCYSCSGEDCPTTYPGRINKCNGNVNQACATVFGTDGKLAARGCSDEVKTICENGSNTCLYCQSTGCNEAFSLSDYVECLHCDTETDTNCLYDPSLITNTRQCYGSCMTALYARNKTDNNPAYELTRTCLDDLELDDRESCELGQLGNCIACPGGKCNTEKLPEASRLSCFICDGDCEDMQELECPAYRADDQCFTLFRAEDNEIIRMGCRSSLEYDYIEENKRNIYYCNGTNCNIEFSPTTYSCAVCNSQNDVNCVTKPNSLALIECSQFPYTQCATFLNEEGALVRDCVYNVPTNDLFDECLSNNTEICTVCASNSCNRDPFPADRLSCLQCDATKDVNCDTGSTEYAAYCAIYDSNDSCVTTIDNGLTIRGCQSQLNCDIADNANCRVCNGTNCNTVNLVKNLVGEPGKWQDLPLSCYTCEGAECSTGLGNSQTCAGNNLQNCMTVFNTNGTVRSRGCSDVVISTQQDFCDANDENCFICKSNNCNNALQISEYIDCYFCDSAERDNCAVNFSGGRSRKCKSACMVALYASSLEINPTYETSRSCLDDKELTAQNACRDGTDKNCAFCSTNLCNIQEIPENRLSCYKCVDETCQTQVPSTCSSYQPDDQCFILYNQTINKVINMGCRSDLPADTVESLTKDKNFWVCNNTNCNNLEALPKAQSCLVCNSALDNRCISNPSAISTFQTCNSVPYVECLTRVTQEGLTERGCLNSLNDNEFYNCLKGNDKLCETCIGDNCNAQNEFPANRLRCHQCSSEKEANCAAAPNSIEVCPLYSENDTCVTAIKNSFTVRGCSSSIECSDNSDSSACRICNSSGCNTVNLEKNFVQGAPGRWQALPLSCYTCNSVTSCASLTNPLKCSTNEHQPCYTVFDTTGAVIERGCKDDVLKTQSQFCDENSENCFGCNSNNCNNAIALTDYVDCLFCDTERDGNCVNNVDTLTSTRKCNKQCVTALYTRANETNPAYGLSRSCLDDLEISDQSTCSAGTNSNCSACSGAKCNTVAIPEKRLSCLHCMDENCDVPTTELCAQYRENDVCYTQFDEMTTVVRLGCRSDFTNEMADYLVSQKYLLTCEGENCNKDVPATYTCSLCNSRTDAECATNPTKVTSATICSKLPYTNCYTRVLPDGATERGCLSNLQDDEFYKCLMGQNEYCKPCLGSYCNRELFPQSRLSCHICDSATDKNCASNPNSLSVCPVYDNLQSCVSTYNNGIVYRGCSSQLTCESVDPDACESCAKDGCNTGDVITTNDNNYGKWQDLPLTCWDCNGTNCQSSTISEKLCTQNNEQDCVTVFDNSNTVVRRGCAYDTATDYGTWCKANPDKCYNCKSNKCNSAANTTDFVSCLYCDSNTNLECLYNVGSIATYRQCQGGCMTALYPASVSTDPAYELIRTCLNDKEADDQKTCSSGKDGLCKSCVNSNCNTENLPQERLSCYQCNNAEDCGDAVPAICPVYKEGDQCYTLFDDENSVAQLGCLSSFFALTLEEIVATKSVQICNSTNCNSFDNIPTAQKCTVCDSNDNPDCAINPLNVPNVKTCSDLPYTHCYTLLSDDGATQRGCVSDLQTSDFTNCILNQNGTCETCQGDGCNREIYPENRLQCYTCDSETDANCDSNPTTLEYCVEFSADTACATALLGENITVRGCSSDILCDATDRTTCRLCNEKGCNSIQLKDRVEDEYHGVWQSLPLKCYTCNGEQCLSSLGVATTCEGNDNQDCMTVFYPDGNVTRRGCSDYVEDYEDLYCRQNPKNCFRCKSNECNIAWSTDDYVNCLFCDSATNENCATHPANVDFPTRSCYNKCMVAEKGDRIIRSCLDDKELFDQSTCTATSRSGCSSCTGNSCNNFLFPRKKLSCHECVDQACVNSVTKECDYAGDQNNFCFAKYANNRPQLLGCAGDESDDNLFQWAEERVLYTCDTDNCNALTNLPSPNECVRCDGTNAACAQNPANVTTTKTCNALIPECYSLVTKAGLTERGCLADLPLKDESECITDNRCTTCESKQCNNKIYPENRLSCITCKYSENNNCYKDDNLADFGHICKIYDAADVCVSRVVDERVERGCGSEIDCDTNNPDLCVKCSGNNCNKDPLGSSATIFSSNILTILLACSILLAFNKY